MKPIEQWQVRLVLHISLNRRLWIWSWPDFKYGHCLGLGPLRIWLEVWNAPA